MAVAAHWNRPRAVNRSRCARAFGLVMVYSASFIYAQEKMGMDLGSSANKSYMDCSGLSGFRFSVEWIIDAGLSGLPILI